MTEGRSYRAQLSTAHGILAMGRRQIAEYEATGAHADRIDGLRKLEKTWTARIKELEPLAAEEVRRAATGSGSAFGL